MQMPIYRKPKMAAKLKQPTTQPEVVDLLAIIQG
jgi:hypothetical protein